MYVMERELSRKFAFGYHSETKGSVLGPFLEPEVYLSHTLDTARAYGEDSGTVYLVEYTGSSPLLLDTPEAFMTAWGASGAEEVEGRFHPDRTRKFAEWARERGYDAIIIPESAFEGELGYEIVAGTFGEPQTIVLYPELARIIERCYLGPEILP